MKSILTACRRNLRTCLGTLTILGLITGFPVATAAIAEETVPVYNDWEELPDASYTYHNFEYLVGPAASFTQTVKLSHRVSDDEMWEQFKIHIFDFANETDLPEVLTSRFDISKMTGVDLIVTIDRADNNRPIVEDVAIPGLFAYPETPGYDEEMQLYLTDVRTYYMHLYLDSFGQGLIDSMWGQATVYDPYKGQLTIRGCLHFDYDIVKDDLNGLGMECYSSMEGDLLQLAGDNYHNYDVRVNSAIMMHREDDAEGWCRTSITINDNEIGYLKVVPAMSTEEIRNQVDEMVESGGEGCLVISEDGTYDVPLKDYTPGNYYLIYVIIHNEEDIANPHTWFVGAERLYVSESDWCILKEKVTYSDCFVRSLLHAFSWDGLPSLQDLGYENDVYTCGAEVFRARNDVDNKGQFWIVGAYRELYENSLRDNPNFRYFPEKDMMEISRYPNVLNFYPDPDIDKNQFAVSHSSTGLSVLINGEWHEIFASSYGGSIFNKEDNEELYGINYDGLYKFAEVEPYQDGEGGNKVYSPLITVLPKGNSYEFIWCDPRDFMIDFNTIPSGINSTALHSDDVEYFNLQGQKVNNPTKGTFLIVRKGNKVDKIIY